jgi:predicted permease
MPLSSQLKHVVRRLGRTPMFTLITLLTLAIGIGANTAIFSVVEGVLLKPLPYPHPEELVGVWHTAPGVNITDLNAAPSLYFVYRDESRTFRHVGMWREGAATVTGLAEPERVGALYVTDGILQALDVPPVLGRPFSEKDDQPGSPATVILTHGYWQSRFGGDPAVIGRRLVVDGEAREVMGVMPSRFRFLDVKASLIVPMQIDRSKTHLGMFSYQSLARLKPGATIQEANRDVARMLPMALQRFEAPPGFSKKMFEEARLGPNLRPLQRDLVGDVGKVLWVLMGTIGMVLLIACANVANLLLVRTEGRQQELAVRAALGAGWGQIARELLLESVLLGLLGGALGLGLAYAAVRLMVALAPANLPRLDEIGIDPPVLLFALVVSLLSTVLFGLIPILKHAGPHLGTGLRSAGRGASESRERHRARNGLVVLQVALALVLLVSSGLMIRSFRALRDVQPGFVRPQELQTFRISIPEAQVKDEEAAARMQQALLGKVAALPGVSSAGLASTLPMDQDGWNDPIFAEDKTYTEGQIPTLRRFKFVAPGGLETLGTPLVAGRAFDWTETYNRTPVAMVSENLARELWGDPAAALGKRIRESLKSEWREVVGVVADVHEDGMDQKAPTLVYWPILMKGFEGDGMCRSLVFLLRTPRAGTEALMKEARQAVWSVNPNLPLASVRTLQSVYERSMARTSFTLVMLALAGGMALLLGVIGIYGVVSYAVSQRTREIGIRMALGAHQRELTGMFVRHGLRLAAIGAGFGLLAAAGLSRLMTSLLFGVSPADPATYASVALGLVAAAVVASYVPARRVTDVDPVEALRAE